MNKLIVFNSTVKQLFFALILLFLLLFLILFFYDDKTNLYTLAGFLLFFASVYLLLFNKNVLIYLTFFLIPLSQVTNVFDAGMSISFPSELFLAILAMISVYCVMKSRKVLLKKILFHPITVLILINTLIMIGTTFTSEMVEVSTKRTAMRINYVLVGFILMVLWMKNSRNILKPFLFYSLGLFVVICLVLRQHARYDFMPQVVFSIPQPYFDEHTVYGACIAYLIPVSFYFTNLFLKSNLHFSTKLLSIVILLFFVTGEIMAFSRAAWLSVVVVFAFYFLLRIKTPIWVYSMLFLVSLSTIYLAKDVILDRVRENKSVSNDGNVTNHVTSITNVKTDASNLERINRWICAYRMFEEKPITGFGPGTYQFQYAYFQTHDIKTYISTNSGNRGNAHSEYLTYLSESGIFGFISFLGLVLYSLYSGVNSIYKSSSGYIKNCAIVALLGLTTFYFHGIFNCFIDQDKMALLVFPSFAILVAVDIYHKHKVLPQDEI